MKALILDILSSGNLSSRFPIPLRLTIISLIIECFTILAFFLWSLIEHNWALEILTRAAVKILIFSVWFSLWAYLNRNKPQSERIFQIFVCISIWLSVFIVTMQFAQWFGKWSSPTRAHFNYLAYFISAWEIVYYQSSYRRRPDTLRWSLVCSWTAFPGNPDATVCRSPWSTNL